MSYGGTLWGCFMHNKFSVKIYKIFFSENDLILVKLNLIN
jgi:hypothetical protein